MKPTHLIARLCLLTASWFAVEGCSPPAQEAPAREYTPVEISTASIDELRALIDAGKGSVVVVNLWATWCPPCVTEMPGLARFYLKYHDQDVIFLSFSGDDPGTIGEKVRPFANSYELPFPVWVMDEAERELLNAGLGINWDGLYPTTFLFARDGSLIQTWEGEVTYEALSDAVDNAAGQQKGQEVKPN